MRVSGIITYQLIEDYQGDVGAIQGALYHQLGNVSATQLPGMIVLDFRAILQGFAV